VGKKLKSISTLSTSHRKSTIEDGKGVPKTETRSRGPVFIHTKYGKGTKRSTKAHGIETVEKKKKSY